MSFDIKINNTDSTFQIVQGTVSAEADALLNKIIKVVQGRLTYHPSEEGNRILGDQKPFEFLRSQAEFLRSPQGWLPWAGSYLKTTQYQMKINALCNRLSPDPLTDMPRDVLVKYVLKHLSLSDLRSIALVNHRLQQVVRDYFPQVLKELGLAHPRFSREISQGPLKLEYQDQLKCTGYLLSSKNRPVVCHPDGRVNILESLRNMTNLTADEFCAFMPRMQEWVESEKNTAELQKCFTAIYHILKKSLRDKVSDRRELHKLLGLALGMCNFPEKLFPLIWVCILLGPDPKALHQDYSEVLTTLASFCAHHNDQVGLQLLLDQNVDIHQVDNEGRTPLHAATVSRPPDRGMVQFLVHNGATVDAKTNEGYTPLCNLVFQQPYDENNSAIAKFLMDRGANIEAADHTGFTPLCWAVERTNINWVRFLLENNANIHATNNVGNTPLKLAIRRGSRFNKGNLDMIKLLVANGATVGEDDVWLAYNDNGDSEAIRFLNEEKAKLPPQPEVVEEAYIPPAPQQEAQQVRAEQDLAYEQSLVVDLTKARDTLAEENASLKQALQTAQEDLKAEREERQALENRLQALVAALGIRPGPDAAEEAQERAEAFAALREQVRSLKAQLDRSKK